MLRSGFDIRTVQHWMGHKSVETTMRYLVPARDVHVRLDRIAIPEEWRGHLGKSNRKEQVASPDQLKKRAGSLRGTALPIEGRSAVG